MLKEHAGRTRQLRHNHALRTVDDKGTGVCHERNFAHVDFLLPDLLGRRLADFAVKQHQALLLELKQTLEAYTGKQLTEERRAQVGTAERAEKIRTYNFPQDRMTDHRFGLSFHNLPRLMDGQLDEVINALIGGDEAQQLEAQYA